MARGGANKAQMEQIALRTLTKVQVSSYSGPLPPPDLLAQYEQIVPGGAERIFAQFEGQAAHRQSLELKVISSNTFSQKVGLWGGLLIGLVAVSGGIFLQHEGRGVEGFGVFFTTLASLVGVFVYGRRSQAAERKSKQS